jgi:2-hydroxy-3-oxopropionate reductase
MAVNTFTERDPVGFIGLGVMGRPMARWLHSRSWALHVYARRKEAAQPFVDAGAVLADTPAALGRMCRLVLLCLSDDDAVAQVLFGPDGLHEGLAPGSVVVDMSTIAASSARSLAERLSQGGVTYLDAPISGGQQGAEAATLTCMIGGPVPAVAAVSDVLRVFSRKICHVGDVGAGQTVKACNQIAAACALLGVGDAIALASSQGVSPEVMCDVLLSGTARSFVLERDAPRIIKGDYKPGFRARLMHKDLRVALKTAQGKVRLQAAPLAERLLDELCRTGGAELDWSAVGRSSPG